MKKLLYSFAFLSLAAQAQQDPISIRANKNGLTYEAGQTVDMAVYFSASEASTNKFSMWLISANDTLVRYDVTIADLSFKGEFFDINNDQVDDKKYYFSFTMPTIRTDINHLFAWYSKKNKGLVGTILNTKVTTALFDDFVSPNAAKIVGMYDLNGKPVKEANGVVIALFSDGSKRKIVVK